MEGMSIGWSVNCRGPSLNLIKKNVPQSKVTEPKKGNVVTVFGNLEKLPQLYVEKRLSSRLFYRLLVTFLPEKQCMSPAKKQKTQSVGDEKKSLRQ